MSFDESKLKAFKYRSDMVKVVRMLGIQDERVLHVMNNVARHEFILQCKPDIAYDDTSISIGHGQILNQPVLIAYLAEAAEIQKSDNVLEIGAGCGYGAAILARLGNKVVSTEIIPELYEVAKSNLERLNFKNVSVVLSEGTALGSKKHAPYDAIVVTGSTTSVPNELKRLLAINGRLIVPVRCPLLGGDKVLRVVRVTQGDYTEEVLSAAQFTPLISYVPQL